MFDRDHFSMTAFCQSLHHEERAQERVEATANACRPYTWRQLNHEESVNAGKRPQSRHDYTPRGVR